MDLIEGVAVFGEAEPGALAQAINCKKEAVHVALMADNHKGYAVPIGGVVAYDGKISPSGVGYDIACGNKAVKTDFNLIESYPDPEFLRNWTEAAMDLIWKTISFGMGRKNRERVDDSLFDDGAWSLKQFRVLRDKAAAQLGTIGSGNHYVDLLVDEEGWLWIGVHFGSRGLGHGVATWALKEGGALDQMDADPLVIDVNSPLGSEYLAGMYLAGRYAYAGRNWVCQKVADLLGVGITEEVHNHHNFAWKETHSFMREGRWEIKEVWVVRKGATPANPGQPGFVGGTMGEPGVILKGKQSFLSTSSRLEEAFPREMALFSTVHGAGRLMSRSQARGKIRRRRYGSEWRTEIVKPGRINQQDMRAWLNREGVVLRGGGLDEAPQAYKRLPEVLAAHSSTVDIVHTLRPLGVAMAGENEFDPYKD